MTKIIDADGHIVEPRTFWQDYVEPDIANGCRASLKMRTELIVSLLETESPQTVFILLPRCAYPEGWRNRADE